MGKITKIKHSSKKYFDIALMKSEQGDNIGSLNLLRTAYENLEDLYSDEDFDIRLEIAETYARMGLIYESNKHYFRMLNYDYCIDETIFSLIRNFLMIDNESAAAFYVHFGLSEGVFDEDDNIESLITHVEPKNRLRLVKKDDNEYILQVAKQLMNSDDIEYSKQMLTAISPDSEHYEDALNCLALIEMKNGNTEKGVQHCDAALLRNPHSLSALTTKLLGLKILERTDEANEIVESIDDIEVHSLSEISRLVICFAELGNNEFTKKYTEAALKLNPYDMDMSILNICAEFNLGNYEKAKKLLGTLCVIYPEEIEPVLLMWKIESLEKSGAKLKLSSGLSESDYEFICRKLEMLVAGCDTSFEMLFLMESDRIFHLSYYALLRDGRNFPLLNSVNKLFCSKDNDDFYGNLPALRDLLCDPDIPIISKKNLFYHSIYNESYSMSAVVCNNKARWFSPFINNYTFKNTVLKEVYCKLYSSLAFLDVDFERKLKLWYKKLADAYYQVYGNKAGQSSDSLAAAFAYLSKINVIFSKPEACCEIFDGNTERFNEYVDAVSRQLKENKTVKKSAKATLNSKAAISTKDNNNSPIK